MSEGQKQKVVERIVRDYLEAYPLEAYEGRVTTGEVESTVYFTLNRGQTTPPPIDPGMIYDAIRLLGPCGEKDWKWLRKWGGARIEWVEDRPVVGASIDEWGQLTTKYQGGRMI